MRNFKILKELLILFTITLFVFSCNKKEIKDVIISDKPVESETQTESPEVLNRLNALKEIDVNERMELRKLDNVEQSGVLKSVYRSLQQRGLHGGAPYNEWVVLNYYDNEFRFFTIKAIDKNYFYGVKSNASSWFFEECRNSMKRQNKRQEIIDLAKKQREALLFPLKPNIN